MTKNYTSIIINSAFLSALIKVNKIGNKHLNNISYLRVLFLCLVFLIFGRINGQGASCSSPTSLIVNGAAITGLANDTTVNDPTAATCITGTIVQRLL